MKNKETESGSIFFYILLGIALFAALSYAVTQTMRLSSGNTSGAKKDLMALNYVDLQDFFESVKIRVHQMEYDEGISVPNMDFRSRKYQDSGGGENCWNDNITCSSASCHVFSDYNSSGIAARTFENISSTIAQDTAGRPVNGSLAVGQIRVAGIGSTDPELVVIIRGVNPEFCNFYNAKQGVTTNLTDTSQLEALGESTTTSVATSLNTCVTTTSFNTTNNIGNAYTAFKGKKTFCAPADWGAFAPTLAIWFVVKVR